MKSTYPVILNAVKDPAFWWAVPRLRDHPASHGGRGRPPSRWILLPHLRDQNVRLRGFLGLFLALSSLLFAPRSPATELIDLGQGLGYLRVHTLVESLKPLAGNSPLVLDLRRTTATPEMVALFTTAHSRRDASWPLFILVGPDTPPDLASVLKDNLLTLGIKGSKPEPQVTVDQSAEADRAAYDALESGADLAQLISGKIEKERFDEALLVHEFRNGTHHAQPPEARPAPGKEPSPAAPAPAPVPAHRGSGKEGGSQGVRLTDRVLQRAVHLHRAMLALKR